MARHDEMIMYAATENSSLRLNILFESGANTVQGIIRAAQKAINAVYHPDSNPFTTNGYQITRYTPVAIVPPAATEDSEELTNNGTEPNDESGTTST